MKNFSLKNTLLLAIVTLLSAACTQSPVTKYYVSSNGNDANPGTKAQAFQTLQKGFDALHPGDTLIVFPGEYNEELLIKNVHGKADSVFHVLAADINNKPLLFGGVKIIGSSYLHLKGFELTKTQFDMYGQDAHHNVIENFDVHHIEGVQIAFSMHKLTHDNLILNCDFHHNVLFEGSHCDGIAIWGDKRADPPDGPYNNRVMFCRSYFNNDDGFDTWWGGAGNYIEGCWAFGNGKDENFNDIQGDGNGFKMGQGKYNYTKVVNSIAWKNRHTGFDENSNQAGGVTVYNCTAWRNDYNNFDFWEPPATDKVINNISFEGNIYLEGADDSNNSWNLELEATADDFVT
ncbi:MAG: DUF1565 domain-containing protein, partial [Desulfobacterales bacterium]|nr:DUF1565 domain-containing protein [Desulfobacterales bacterium]